MSKRGKRIAITLGIVVVVLGAGGTFMYQNMKNKTEEALSKQVNADIDMEKVKDGTYKGASDGGMVSAEVEVTVKDHTIQSIVITKHENGKGKPAEAIVDTMIEKNTDKVDVVSGATASSKTIRNAVNVALQKGIK